MDPNPFNRQRPPAEGSVQPARTGPAVVPFNNAFGMAYIPPGQPVPQAPVRPPTNQQKAQSGANRGKREYQTPSSQKRRQRRRRSKKDGEDRAQAPESPAPAPLPPATEEHPNPPPMNSAGQGPVGFMGQAPFGFMGQVPFGFMNQGPFGFMNQGPFGFPQHFFPNMPVEPPIHYQQSTPTNPLPLKPTAQTSGPAKGIPGISSSSTDAAQEPSTSAPSRNGNRPSSRSTEKRDTIVAPSPASGGIPEPTPAYLLRASFLPLPSPVPRPLLVVMDLNGTLLYRPNKRGAPSRFVERPLAKEFLRACLDNPNIRVAIWSSARPENVGRMCAQLLSLQDLARVVAVWGRDRFGLSQDDYNRRTQCYKRLTRLWSDPAVSASHPEASLGSVWNQGNTVLIDDSPEKARSEPHNAVTLPEFTGNVNERPHILSLVLDYLDQLAWQMDISTYIRVRPFTVQVEQ